MHVIGKIRGQAETTTAAGNFQPQLFCSLECFELVVERARLRISRTRTFEEADDRKEKARRRPPQELRLASTAALKFEPPHLTWDRSGQGRRSTVGTRPLLYTHSALSKLITIDQNQ